MKYYRKTARYNGKKYEATGKPELEAMTKLADKLAAGGRSQKLKLISKIMKYMSIQQERADR